MTNDDLSRQFDALRSELRSELRDYVDKTFVTKDEFETRLDRQTHDIVRQVSATLNAFTKDAIREIFEDLYDDQRKKDRQELVATLAGVLNKTSTVARILQPLITILGVLFGMWVTGNT